MSTDKIIDSLTNTLWDTQMVMTRLLLGVVEFWWGLLLIWPGETISSAAYRAQLHGGHFRHARPVIDWLFSPLQTSHCFEAWRFAITKGNLPEDMR